VIFVVGLDVWRAQLWRATQILFLSGKAELVIETRQFF
jgi:hypothetical protein